MAAVGALALLLTGCGGGSSGEGGSGEKPPKAAEPADSPPLAATPVGTVEPLGAKPEGIVVDAASGIVAAAVTTPPSLVLLRARDGSVLREVDLPSAPRHLSLEGPGGPVLVPAEDVDALITVTLPGGSTTTTPVGRHPHDATEAAGVTFVADEYAGLVSLVKGGDVARTVDVEGQPGGIAAVGDTVGLVDVRRRVLKVLDAPSGDVVATLPAGEGPTHAAAARGSLYVVDTQGDAILRYSLDPKPRFLGRFPVTGTPYGIAVDEPGGRLFVTQTRSNRVVELRMDPSADGAGLSAGRSFPTARQPNSAAFDPGTGRLFISGNADGVLQTISVGGPR